MSGYDEAAQNFCCLPWCGHTGKINLHHIIPRSQGGLDTADNLLPICHACHMWHHSAGGYRLTVVSQDVIEGHREVYVQRDDGVNGWCVFADEARDAPPPEVLPTAEAGAVLDEIEDMLLANGLIANRASWEQSLAVRDACDIFRWVCSDREAVKRLTEWGEELCDARGDRRPIAPSTMRKMLHTSRLPATPEVIGLSLTERDRLLRAMQGGAEFDVAVEAIYRLGREDFDTAFLGKDKWIEREAHD